MVQCLATRSYASATRLEVDEDTGDYKDAQTEIPALPTVVQQAENIVHQQSEALVEPETAQQQPVGEHDRPTSWAEQTTAEESSVQHKQQQSEPESEDTQDSSGDRDGDDESTGAKEVDDDGFVKPTSHKRRQRRVKRAVDSMEPKNTTTSDSEGASKRLRSRPESSATASASTIMDPTAGRQHSRTRVPSRRRASYSAATLFR